MRLGYYIPKFPLPQGRSAGPYKQFVGRAHTACVIVGIPPPRVPIRNAPQNGCGCKGHGSCGCKPHRRPQHRSRLHSRMRGLGQSDPYSDQTAYDNATSAGMPAGVLDTSGQLVPGSAPYDPNTGLPLTAPNSLLDTSLSPLAPGDTTPAGAVQSPPGTTLIYSATWSAGLANLMTSADSAISSLGNLLASMNTGMSIQSGQATSSGPINYGIQVAILDSIGHQNFSDAKSVLDSLMQQIVGNNLKGSTLTPGTGLSTSWLSWLENNGFLVAGVAIAAYVAWKVL